MQATDDIESVVAEENVDPTSMASNIMSEYLGRSAADIIDSQRNDVTVAMGILMLVCLRNSIGIKHDVVGAIKIPGASRDCLCIVATRSIECRSLNAWEYSLFCKKKHSE